MARLHGTLIRERPFTRLVYEQLVNLDLNQTEGDPVHFIRERISDTQPLSDMVNEDPDWPAYSDIVLELYYLATRTYWGQLGWDEFEMEGLICQILERCSYHKFNSFLRLTNPRHNRNDTTWRWAVNQLLLIMSGVKGVLGGFGDTWERGATRRLRQLRIPTFPLSNEKEGWRFPR